MLPASKMTAYSQPTACGVAERPWIAAKRSVSCAYHVQGQVRPVLQTEQACVHTLARCWGEGTVWKGQQRHLAARAAALQRVARAQGGIGAAFPPITESEAGPLIDESPC